MNNYWVLHKMIPLLLCLLFLSCIKEEPAINGDFSLQTGDNLPPFSITNKDGQVSTNDLAGKVSLIVFFNTTCRDCQHALPDIWKIYQEYTGKPGFIMTLIAREQTEEEVKLYFEEQGYPMPFFTDKARKVYSLFADNTIPRFFLSGKDKKIVMTQATTLDKQKLTNQIDLLLSLPE